MTNRWCVLVAMTAIGGCGVPGIGHAVMLSNLATDCTQTEGAISCTRASGAANLIYASTATAATFTHLDAETTLFEGATFTSERGLSPIVLSTPNVTVTGTYGSTGYALSGLTEPPFVGAQSMTVSAPAAAPTLTPITLSAPSSAPTFGALRGWSTEVILPDGGFDALYVFAHDASGRSGVLHEVPAREMVLRGANRVAPILPDEVLAELARRDITISGAIVGSYREVMTTALFPGRDPVPVQAGSLVDLPLAAVTP